LYKLFINIKKLDNNIKFILILVVLYIYIKNFLKFKKFLISDLHKIINELLTIILHQILIYFHITFVTFINLFFHPNILINISFIQITYCEKIAIYKINTRSYLNTLIRFNS
jgi:hypothetical protein